MRHQWRLLLRQSYRRSHLPYLSHFQVTSISLRPLSSFTRIRPGDVALEQTERPLVLESPLMSSVSLGKSLSRNFSSEPAVNEKSSDDASVIEIFSRLRDNDEIRKELVSSGIVITHDLVLKVLRKLQTDPDDAKRFFQWVLEADATKISPKSYNTMLRILGVNGFVDEFWNLVDAMKKMGYGVSANVRDKVGEKFEKDGLQGDLERLKGLFASGSMDDSLENVCRKVFKIVKNEEWSADVEKRLTDLKVEFGSELVKMVVDSLEMEPRKALLFFRWIDESGLFKHDEKTYNAIARVLGREKFLDRFVNIIKEMRNASHELEMETYVRVSTRFCQTKMIKEAVELFEFAMAGSNTPTPNCCVLLLKKIVTAKELDMGLFSRTVKAYTKGGNALTDSMLKSVIKSLRSVDRFDQSNDMLKAMKEEGYSPSGDLQSVIALGLSRKDKKDGAKELENFMEVSGNNLDDKAMASLVEFHCGTGDLKQASECFKKMIGKEGVLYADYTFEKLVLAYCNRNRVRDAYKLCVAHVKQNQLKPSHSTYKILLRSLLKKKSAKDGGFEEALDLLPMMKDHGFPPFVDPFVDYLSKTGTSTHAFAFLKAMTSKKFPSTAMVLRLFEAMLKSGRRYEAQYLLSLCPKDIRGHADVLDLFNSMKPGECNVEKPLDA